jgi:hypothetical protein
VVVENVPLASIIGMAKSHPLAGAAANNSMVYNTSEQVFLMISPSLAIRGMPLLRASCAAPRCEGPGASGFDELPGRGSIEYLP